MLKAEVRPEYPHHAASGLCNTSYHGAYSLYGVVPDSWPSDNELLAKQLISRSQKLPSLQIKYSDRTNEKSASSYTWLAIHQICISRHIHKGTSLLCGIMGVSTAPPQQDNLIVGRESGNLHFPPVFTLRVYKRADGAKEGGGYHHTPEFTIAAPCESSKDVCGKLMKNNHFCTLTRELQAKSRTIEDLGHFVRHKLLSWEICCHPRYLTIGWAEVHYYFCVQFTGNRSFDQQKWFYKNIENLVWRSSCMVCFFECFIYFEGQLGGSVD